MTRKQKILVRDGCIIGASIALAIVLAVTGALDAIVFYFGELKLFGVFLAGMFFTFLLTTAPSVAVLSSFAGSIGILPTALVGALGALVADYLIFKLIKDHLADDILYLFQHKGKKGVRSIFETKLFRFFVPFIGALVLASPLPDDVGVAILGISKLKERVFVLIAYPIHVLGILTITWIVTSIAQ